VYDVNTHKPSNGVLPVPIDLNDNGKIDADENFYDNIDQIVTAITEGRYPSPPARELYFVTNGQPGNEAVIEFIRWVLTDGQKFVKEGGYIKLSDAQLKNETDKLVLKK
jgi:phosphate transport system substrate-binding protein